jgi:hypothetical protein
MIVTDGFWSPNYEKLACWCCICLDVKKSHKRWVNYFAVLISAQRLYCFQVPHLNCCFRVQYFWPVVEQLRHFHIPLRTYNLAFGIPACHRRRHQLPLQLLAYRKISLIISVPFKNILSTSTPQWRVIGSICFSMSTDISSRFYNNSWNVNCATVFLIIPPDIFITDWSKFDIRNVAKCGFSMW